MKVLLGPNSIGLRMIERDDPLGITMFLSWDQIAEDLRISGNVKEISAFVLSDEGIYVRFKS